MDKEFQGIPEFDKTPEVDPEEFYSAFMLYVNAAARKVLVENPSKRSFPWKEEDGSIKEYRLTNNPISRGLTALSSRFRDDEQKYFAISNRIYALRSLFIENALGKWSRKVKGGEEVHEAVIEVAARFKMTKEGKFPREEFLKEVARVAKENYPEED